MHGGRPYLYVLRISSPRRSLGKYYILEKKATLSIDSLLIYFCPIKTEADRAYCTSKLAQKILSILISFLIIYVRLMVLHKLKTSLLSAKLFNMLLKGNIAN